MIGELIRNPMAGLDGSHWDVVVIGAGPAGAFAARELARRDLRVLLVDKRTFPRDKVCGCCLNGRVIEHLHQAGLSDLLDGLNAAQVSAFRLSSNARTAMLPLPKGRAVARSLFDDALATAAVEEGVRFQSGVSAHIADVGNDGRQVLLRSGGENAAVTARIVVCAAGLGGVASSVGKCEHGEWVDENARIGAWQIVETPDDSCPEQTICMAVTSLGYVGSVRIEFGRLNVAAALEQQPVREIGIHRTVMRILDESGADEIGGLIENAWQGTQPLTRRLLSPAWERVFTIGDAAGYVQPFTGEGIAWAIESALEVVPFAVAGCKQWRPELVDGWNRAHRRRIVSRQRICRWLSWALGKPAVFGTIARILAAYPKIATPVIRRMNGQVNSIGGPVR